VFRLARLVARKLIMSDDNLLPASFSEAMTFPGRFESLAEIGGFVSQAARAAGFDTTAVYAVEMAVDEACTNIIEHAYGGEGRGVIEINCRVQGDELTVTLRDYGHPFDPARVPEPDINAGLEERREGGLGLYLMRKLMDEVHFDFTSGLGNVLTLVKRRETTP
jgi:serine/threonine-protein kinase RsbW